MKKVILVLLAMSLTIQVQAKSTSKQIDALLNDLFEKNGPGGVALVVKDGKTIYRKAFGMANLELGVKMKPDHIFRIGSITKQFTAVAILKLIEEGKIKLNADITEYIKDYPTQGHQITIEQLLNHTSGIKSYTSMKKWDSEARKRDFTPAELVDYFKNQPMDFKPGEEFRYNNSGYILLGHIIELVSGKTYEEYIQENIFTPLNMENSSYGSTSRIIKNRAYGYDKANENYKNADFLSMTQPYAAGSLLSTIDDVHKWYKAVLADKVISKENREKAHNNSTLNNAEKIDYGFGWRIGNIQATKMIEHGGGINGFLTASLVLPEEDVFVAIFSNCLCNFPGEIAKQVAAITIDKPFEWEKVSLDDDLLKSYQAVYQQADENQRIISYKDGKLFSLRTGGSKYEIFPFAKDKFFFEDEVLTLEFNRDSNDAIESVTLHSTGVDQTWGKTDIAIPSYTAIDVDAAVLDKYVGKYELAPEFYINIFKDKDMIFTQATGQNKLQMIAFDQNKFVLKDTDIKISINLDESGQSISLTLHQNGNHEAKKVE
jgi:CubicO group peptidase (beta-lactamase class C family)